MNHASLLADRDETPCGSLFNRVSDANGQTYSLCILASPERERRNTVLEGHVTVRLAVGSLRGNRSNSCIIERYRECEVDVSIRCNAALDRFRNGKRTRLAYIGEDNVRTSCADYTPVVLFCGREASVLFLFDGVAGTYWQTPRHDRLTLLERECRDAILEGHGVGIIRIAIRDAIGMLRVCLADGGSL